MSFAGRMRPLAVCLGLAFFGASVTRPAAAANGDWTTYAHDDRRTGFQPADMGITRATARSLHLRWSIPLKETATASPIVAGDTVFVATERGNVYALRTDNGRVRWKRNVGNIVRMTPALVHGRLLVGTYGFYDTKPQHGASMEALDPASGRILWKTPLAGVVRSEPVVIGGAVYEGIAGGDPESGCTSGRIVTLDERTGKLLPAAWFTSTRPRNGGGIWSPLSFDGRTLYFGTGNTCDDTGAQNAIVAVSPRLGTRWSTPAQAPGGQDEDVGGGAMILGHAAYAEGKSGVLYALDLGTGRPLWTADVHADHPGDGGFATPAGDGTILAVNSGGGSSNPPHRTKLVAFDLSGHERYSIDQHIVSTPSLGASFVRGVGFAGIDKSVVAFDAQTGATLWTYATIDAFYAVSAIAGSSVYDVDLSGNVYAFGRSPESSGSPTTQLSTVAHGVRGVLVGVSAPRHRTIELAALGGAIALGAAICIVVLRRKRR